MRGSPKQNAWAESIRAKVISAIRNDPEFSPVAPQIIDLYSSIESSVWWIDNRNAFQFKPSVLVIGLVMLAQNGEEAACDEILNLQGDMVLAPIFAKLRIEPEEE